MEIEKHFLDLLRCPVSGSKIMQNNGVLMSENGRNEYRITNSGIPLFAEKFYSPDAKRQQDHYDKIAKEYLRNLSYPHTEEYMNYLDCAFLDCMDSNKLGNVLEICCGSGEALKLTGQRIRFGVGFDISLSMLEVARKVLPGKSYFFVQGDAINLPLADDQFDSVFMLGGIHHVNDRNRLYKEIFRILKPGGGLYWREPVNDFFIWRLIRSIVYNVSPIVDARTEKPLRFKETKLQLEMAGFTLKKWRTYGFVGYCFLMNSDVLIFNRLFRYLPGIRTLARCMVKFDDLILKLFRLKHAGLIVVGVAEKPLFCHGIGAHIRE